MWYFFLVGNVVPWEFKEELNDAPAQPDEQDHEHHDHDHEAEHGHGPTLDEVARYSLIQSYINTMVCN